MYVAPYFAVIVTDPYFSAFPVTVPPDTVAMFVLEDVQVQLIFVLSNDVFLVPFMYVTYVGVRVMLDPALTLVAPDNNNPYVTASHTPTVTESDLLL